VGLLQYGHLIQSLKIFQEKEDMKMGLGQVSKVVFHLKRFNKCANLEIAHMGKLHKLEIAQFLSRTQVVVRVSIVQYC